MREDTQKIILHGERAAHFNQWLCLEEGMKTGRVKMIDYYYYNNNSHRTTALTVIVL